MPKKQSNKRHYYDVRQYSLLKNGEGDILVLQLPKRYQPYGGQWTLPGGKLEPSDVPDEGILREIEEETNLQATVDKLLCVAKWDTKASKKLGVFYTCNMDDPSAQPVLSEEHQSCRWVSLEELKEVDFYSPYFRQAVERLLEEQG